MMNVPVISSHRPTRVSDASCAVPGAHRHSWGWAPASALSQLYPSCRQGWDLALVAEGDLLANRVQGIGVRDRNEPQAFDAGEVAGVARVQGQVMGDGDRCDHGVKGSGSRLASSPTQGSSDPPERSGGAGVKWERIEIGLRLLKMGLARRPLLFGWRYQGTDREFRKGDR
jgi:hypothetical protein